MQGIVFTGVQATGNSSFFAERFAATHVRINLDMLKTRHRERLLLACCIEMKQPFVVDNTNPTAADRARYLEAARGADFEVIGYYFQSRIADALERNRQRPAESQVPERGILATYSKLELPGKDEGFDELYHVHLTPEGTWIVEEWRDEV